MNPSQTSTPTPEKPGSRFNREFFENALKQADARLRWGIEFAEACIGNSLIQPKYRTGLLCALLLLLSWKLCFNHLGAFGDALNFDEVKYATLVDGLHASKSWSTPKLFGQPFLSKPPLYLWLTSSTYNYFPDGPYRYRFWSALFGVGCVLLTFAAGTRLFNPLAGFLGGVVLLSCEPFLFYHGARWGTFDTALTFFIFGALLVYWQSRDQFWIRWPLAGLLLGLAGLLNVFIGLPVFLLMVFHAFVFDKPANRRKYWIGFCIALIISLLITLPWYVAEWVRNGNVYLSVVFHQHIWNRVTGLGDSGHYASPLYYFTHASTLSPVFFLLWPAVAWMAWNARETSRRAALSFLLTAGLGWLVVCTLSHDKPLWYIYPALPALALCIGWLLLSVVEYVSTRLITAASVIFWRVGAVTLLTVALLHQPYWLTHWRAPSFAPALLLQKTKQRIKSDQVRLLTALDDSDMQGIDTTGFYLRHLLRDLKSEEVSAGLLSEHRPTIIVANVGTSLKSLFTKEAFYNRIDLPTFSRGEDIVAFQIDTNAVYNESSPVSQTLSAIVTQVDPLPDPNGHSFKDKLTLRIDMPEGVTVDAAVQLSVTIRLQVAAAQADPVAIQIGGIGSGKDLLQRDAVDQTLHFQISPHVVAKGSVIVSLVVEPAVGSPAGATPFAGDFISATAVFPAEGQ